MNVISESRTKPTLNVVLNLDETSDLIPPISHLPPKFCYIQPMIISDKVKLLVHHRRKLVHQRLVDLLVLRTKVSSS